MNPKFFERSTGTIRKRWGSPTGAHLPWQLLDGVAGRPGPTWVTKKWRFLQCEAPQEISSIFLGNIINFPIIIPNIWLITTMWGPPDTLIYTIDIYYCMVDIHIPYSWTNSYIYHIWLILHILYTLWGPPVISWFRFAPVTIVICVP